jgi:hypothetical protein
MVERDIKKRREREKALDEQILDLMAKNDSLTQEKSLQREKLQAQIHELSAENEMLKNSLALAQARVVSAGASSSARVAVSSSAVPPLPIPVPSIIPTRNKPTAEDEQQEAVQLARAQEHHSRDILSKTRSRPSYIPKPSTTHRKPDINSSSTSSAKSTTSASTTATSTTNSKEDKENSSSASNNDAAARPPTTHAKKRASMIPIRRGSSLLPQQIKSLRD